MGPRPRETPAKYATRRFCSPACSQRAQAARYDAIDGCPRCHGTHERIVILPLTKPGEGVTHWAMCPEMQEPIMLAVMGQPARRPKGVTSGHR